MHLADRSKKIQKKILELFVEIITNTTRCDYHLRHILYLLRQMHFDTSFHLITISLYLLISFFLVITEWTKMYFSTAAQDTSRAQKTNHLHLSWHQDQNWEQKSWKILQLHEFEAQVILTNIDITAKSVQLIAIRNLSVFRFSFLVFVYVPWQNKRKYQEWVSHSTFAQKSTTDRPT